MEYSMEELVPLVGHLAEKYTSLESTSVTYETAAQLMEAVLYCVEELGRDHPEGLSLPGGFSARQAYERGAALVQEKAKASLTLYNRLMENFDDCGDRRLYEIMVKEIPRFFKWYDAVFAPQETIVFLDYPVSKDLSGLTGVDKIWEFLKCIHEEQGLLFSGNH